MNAWALFIGVILIVIGAVYNTLYSAASSFLTQMVGTGITSQLTHNGQYSLNWVGWLLIIFGVIIFLAGIFLR